MMANTPEPNILVVDNFDSFTYNLAQLIRRCGARVTIIDHTHNPEHFPTDIDKIVLSPGPGIPSEAGHLKDVIRHYAGRKPILGVCLGHQAIAEVFGAGVVRLPRVVHGISTAGTILQSDYIFRGMPPTIRMGRYHSWVVADKGFPGSLQVLARSDDGCIMALRHRTCDIRGIQFHPESILTPLGIQMMNNWMYHETPDTQAEVTSLSD